MVMQKHGHPSQGTQQTHYEQVQHPLACFWQQLRDEHHQGLHWLPSQGQQGQEAIIWACLLQRTHIEST